jgi:S-adenosylmethionine synthetase
MARKALITGATGLLGRQVLQSFKESGWEVVGTGFSRAKPPTIRRLDLADASAVESLLDEEK